MRNSKNSNQTITLTDDAIDDLLQNSYDIFDVSYPAGWEAGFSLDVKDNESLTQIFIRYSDKILESREITLKSILKDMKSWLRKKLYK
ncbi:hypothetical protein Henu6_gp99 [Acinetobacter phage Henu6]|uniref:Uncharacterized protein n=2 Tax=Caudoviricetes TaxID=2731619 RepID=A0A410T623_9CAUD|nr:hypothetical protein Henu6_gp99 [Acinetobacter phage Henu6]